MNGHGNKPVVVGSPDPTTPPDRRSPLASGDLRSAALASGDLRSTAGHIGRRRFGRPGFTAMEVVIALALLGTATVLVAQVATTSLAERVRAAERLAAIE